jgi:tetratricopeptide (TPR) repeat protein
MKTKNIWILFPVLFFLAFSPRVGAYSHAGLYFDGIKAFHAGHFDEAASIFSRIAGEGVTNDKLFYNLGNTYYKKNDLGRSILWYERALRLNPEDPDLKFNLEFVRSRVKDLGEDRTNSIFRILFFWKYALSEAAIRWAALISNGIFWILLTLQAMRRKRIPRLVTGVAGTLVLILALTAGVQYYENRFMKKAVILSEKVIVRSGWSEDATELFVLHAGTRVEVEKQERGYYRIYFSKGKIGWVKKETAEII